MGLLVSGSEGTRLLHDQLLLLLLSSSCDDVKASRDGRKTSFPALCLSRFKNRMLRGDERCWQTGDKTQNGTKRAT